MRLPLPAVKIIFMTQTHKLKTHTKYFEQILEGNKTFEIRKDDREFKLGDMLCLQEFDPITKKYTGRAINMNVTSLLKNKPEFGLKEGFVLMSIQPINKNYKNVNINDARGAVFNL